MKRKCDDKSLQKNSFFSVCVYVCINISVKIEKVFQIVHKIQKKKGEKEKEFFFPLPST